MSESSPAHEALDWPFVVTAWAEHTRTSMGSAAVFAATPLADIDAIDAAHTAIDEWLALSDHQIDTGLGEVSDIRDLTEGAARGEVLEDADLRLAGTTLAALIRLEFVLAQHSELAPNLAWTARAIEVDPDVADLLENAWEPTGELSARVWPILGELRKRIQELHNQIRSTLDTLVTAEEMSEHLQDQFWTQRERRYVLPLKHHAKNMGIVHGTSRTGQTVFVEPHQVVALNNSLRVAEGQLAAEEHRIRTELSRALGSQGEAVMTGLATATELDLAAARAGLSRRLEGTRPVVREEGVIRLEAARHPVLHLRGIEVVPNQLGLAHERPALVISGPNAGGKTVALKTVGLCALLVQHGLFVPAAENSRVDRFDQVFAAIGDAQTVEGDLSSFSGHLLALKGLLDRAGTGTLALLDEIATGTDPAQGSALAQAVLETLLDAGARLVVTTHFARLKGIAATDARFAMAATAYEDGRPTYRLVDGTTGESRAFDLAHRVGLDPAVLARARDLMDHGEAELARALDALDLERSRAAQEAKAHQKQGAELAQKAAELADREARIAEHSKALEQQGAEAFLARLRTAEQAIGQVVAELQRNPSHQGVQAAHHTVDALKQLVPQAPTQPVRPPPSFAVGDTVQLKKVGKPAEVLEVKGKTVRVRSGGLTLTVKPGELEPATPSARPAPQKSRSTAAPAPSSSHAIRIATNTLDMRGMRVEEGLSAAEAFFDKAVLGGQDTVFLLHGHGTGALKAALRSWLRTCAYVDNYGAADDAQGGDAFTRVSLK